MTKWNIWMFRFFQSISIIDFLLWMKNETIIWQCLKKFSDANKLLESQGSLIVCFPRRQPWGYATDLHHSSVNNSMHSAHSKCSASVFSKEFSCVYNSGLRMDIGLNTCRNSSTVNYVKNSKLSRSYILIGWYYLWVTKENLYYQSDQWSKLSWSDTMFCLVWSGSTRFAQVCLSHYLGKEMMVVSFTGKCCSNLKQVVTCMFLIRILWPNRGPCYTDSWYFQNYLTITGKITVKCNNN